MTAGLAVDGRSVGHYPECEMGNETGRPGGSAKLRPLFKVARVARVARLARVGRSSRADEPSPDLVAATCEEILPRITLAHAASAPVAADARMPPTEEEVAQLAELVVEHDLEGAVALVTSMVGQGLSLDSVLLLLVAPAARLLGDGWNAEHRPFTDVMGGLEILQEVAAILTTSSASTSDRE